MESSPAASDYSLPWLDSDDTPQYVDDIDIWGMSDGYILPTAESMAISTLNNESGIVCRAERPPSPALPTTFSQVAGSTSQERTYTVRQFPLQEH